jgi:hypothetical protein
MEIIQSFEYRGYDYHLIRLDDGTLAFKLGAFSFPADNIYSLCRVEDFIDFTSN